MSRAGMDEESLADLARDIRLKGLLVPLIVCRQGERYEIVAGHRRSPSHGRGLGGGRPPLPRLAAVGSTLHVARHAVVVQAALRRPAPGAGGHRAPSACSQHVPKTISEPVYGRPRDCASGGVTEGT